ncbi:HD domain-containing protein [Azotosporobacter soli]|uniref:HD domain-containing protein n=1 Tax=Azotosporobacter soli TaxID=3055040 RepID=UPI0031FF035E
MSSFNFDSAVAAFRRYTASFEQKDPLIALKYDHTFGVVQTSLELSNALRLNEEDTSLAALIALLHDIGRFWQVDQSGSFTDTQQLDHAAYGCQLLFDEGHIREYLADCRFDALLRFAIANHSAFSIAPCPDPQMLLHARLIRDADKLDNFRVKDITSIETLLQVSPQELNRASLSPQIYEQFLHCRQIRREDRKTPLDIYVSYIAFLFDLNFSASYHWLKKHDYVSRLFQRLSPHNPATERQLYELNKSAQRHIRERLDA